jgi:hypothetical protein
MLHTQPIKDLEEEILAKMAEPEVVMEPAEEYRRQELTRITSEFTPTHTAAGIPQPDPETTAEFPMLSAIPETTTERIITSHLC